MCAIFWLTKIAFDPTGLAGTSCDRIQSTTVCHIERHAQSPLGKIGACVVDLEDDGCCFTEKDPSRKNYRVEKCPIYNLDNFTLDALVEGGDEEYQHFQNATGHWVRRHCQSALRRSQQSPSWASAGGLAA